MLSHKFTSENPLIAAIPLKQTDLIHFSNAMNALVTGALSHVSLYISKVGKRSRFRAL